MLTATYLARDGKGAPVEVQQPVMGLVSYRNADGTSGVMPRAAFLEIYEPKIPKADPSELDLTHPGGPTNADLLAAVQAIGNRPAPAPVGPSNADVLAAVQAIATKVDAIHSLIPMGTTGIPATGIPAIVEPTPHTGP